MKSSSDLNSQSPTEPKTRFVVLPYMSLSYAALDPYGTNLAMNTYSGYQTNNYVYQ